MPSSSQTIKNKTRIIHPTDHEGRTYSCMQEMCDHWGVKRSVFMDRRQHGWTLQECLTGRDSRIGKHGRIQDHRGNTYLSAKTMCDAYNINYSSYCSKRRRKIPLAKILEPNIPDTTVIDHKGNQFKNRTAMYQHYNINFSTCESRLQKGWSLEDALTTPTVKAENLTKCQDHTGKSFKTQSDMCQEYGIDLGTYQRRLERGWSVQQALTEPVESTVYTDPFGNTFPELKDMLQHYNVKSSAWYERLKSGHTTEEALGIVPMLGPNTINVSLTPDLTILRPIPDEINGKAFYFTCLINNELTVMTRHEIVRYLMTKLINNKYLLKSSE